MLKFQTQQEQLIHGQIALIVSVKGSIDKNDVRHFENQLQDYFNVGYRFIVLDCSGIDYINSTGLQVLLKMVETFHQAGGIFLFIKVLDQISKFFDMLGFTPIFTSFMSREEALAYLKEQIQKASEMEETVYQEEDYSIKDYQIESFQNRQSPNFIQQPEKTQTALPGQLPVMKSSQNPSVQSKPPVMQSSPPMPSKIPSMPTPPSMPSSSMPAVSSIPKAPAVLGIPATSGVTPGQPQRPMNQSKTNAIVIGAKLSYYKKMSSFQNFPLVISLQALSGQAENHIINIVPHIPGCLVVPDQRLVQFKGSAECTFWVTPLVRKKIKGLIEFWKGEESMQDVQLVSKGTRQTSTLFLFFVAFFTSCIFLVPKAFSFWPSLRDIKEISQFSFAIPIFFIVLFLLSFMKNVPKKASAIHQKIVFQ